MRTTDSRPRFTRPGFIAAASFIIFICFGAASLLAGKSDDGQLAAGSSPVVSSPNHGEETEAPTGCRPSDNSREIPTATPPGVRWELFGAVALPYSSEAGPLIVENTGVARCFARTPLGALIAADQIGTRYILAANWKRVAELQLKPGPGRDALLRWRARRTLNALDTGWAQVTGFRFITYTADTAVIERVMRSADGSLGAYATTLEWDGDWKLVLQPDGVGNAPGYPVEDLDQYVSWSGI